MRGVTIVSGGQTGADRAALDFALEFGLAHGGWCPRGRRAEDGVLDDRYELVETPSHRYDQRTRWNVRDSDATVVFSIAREVTGGTALTLATSADGRDAGQELVDFVVAHGVGRLNVAGPRESQEPQIAAFVRQVLVDALDRSSENG